MRVSAGVAGQGPGLVAQHEQPAPPDAGDPGARRGPSAQGEVVEDPRPAPGGDGGNGVGIRQPGRQAVALLEHRVASLAGDRVSHLCHGPPRLGGGDGDGLQRRRQRVVLESDVHAVREQPKRDGAGYRTSPSSRSCLRQMSTSAVGASSTS